ncbi:hypothetical protein [Scandinavium hiltneri]|uniref:hypothetical protein n=1 Tax=Scandinavium hiltneri TaxID=2926519 RepID=UPI0035B30DED
MLLSHALDTLHKFSPQEFAALADLLSPELIDECLADTGVVTLREMMAVDGTLWRAPDTPENSAAFGRTANVSKQSEWPQLRMVCQMEVTSHLLSAVAFDSVSETGETDLAAQLIAGPRTTH